MNTPPVLSLSQAVEVTKMAQEAEPDAPIRKNKHAFRLTQQSYRYHGRIAANLKRSHPDLTDDEMVVQSAQIGNGLRGTPADPTPMRLRHQLRKAAKKEGK